MDDDEDDLPAVGGAAGGCDCEDCANARRYYYEEMEAKVAPLADAIVEAAAPVLFAEAPAIPKVAKAKRVPKPRKQPDLNVNMRDIKLLPEASITLSKAVAMLRDPAMLEQVHAAKNISHWAMVGPLHADVQMDQICHAGAQYNISSGNNVSKRSGGQRQRHRQSPTNQYRYEYWNDVKKAWQTTPIDLSRPADGTRAFYNYRYMITWSNEKVKPEYHGPDGVPYTKAQVKALREYYWWLRNKSHWSRFFVGPTDRKTLFECGCILDLSAPSCVVHFAAVAWRISGEMVEMPEQWYALVQRGVEPHLAFGMAQNVVGFDKTADPNADIEGFYSAGHNLIGRSTIEQLARLVSGQLYMSDRSQNLRPARIYYSTRSNYAYQGGEEEGWDEDDEDGGGNIWFDRFPKAAKHMTEKPNRWNPAKMDKSYAMRASLFHHPWSKGMVWVLTEVGKYMDKRGWTGYG